MRIILIKEVVFSLPMDESIGVIYPVLCCSEVIAWTMVVVGGCVAWRHTILSFAEVVRCTQRPRRILPQLAYYSHFSTNTMHYSFLMLLLGMSVHR